VCQVKATRELSMNLGCRTVAPSDADLGLALEFQTSSGCVCCKAVLLQGRPFFGWLILGMHMCCILKC